MSEPGIDCFSLVTQMLRRSLLQQIFHTEFFQAEFSNNEFILSLCNKSVSEINFHARNKMVLKLEVGL